MDEATRLKARELLLRSRLYRFIALVFFCLGLALFAFLYYQHVEGDVVAALRRPATVMILLLPFLPAVIFSWMTMRTENRFMKVLEQVKESAQENERGSNKKTS